MTEFVRFDSLYEHKDEATGQRIRYPTGWTGEVEAEVAKGARQMKAVAPAVADPKPSAELVAARRAVTEAEAKLAKASAADKAKAQTDLTAAKEALAALGAA